MEDDLEDQEMGEPPIVSNRVPIVKETPVILSVKDGRQYLPWVEKYRPSRLEDLVAHEDIISIITKLIDQDNLPHLLLYGPPGTGKTSTITAAAKRMYGVKAYSAMALELNASDARGIDVRFFYFFYNIHEFSRNNK